MWVGVPACLAILAGCGATADSPAQPAASAVAAPAGANSEATATVTISGQLRAHDGAPLRAAELFLQRLGFKEAAAKAALAEDGSFRAEVEPGVYYLVVAAVDHAMIGRRILVERAVEVRGNLGTYARADPGESLELRTELLDAAGETLAAGPKAAKRTAKGTYQLDLTDRPAAAVKLRYQLQSDSGRTYNGPLADSYESDGGGDYWSVVALAGREALELDLSALPPAGKAAALTWSGETPEIAAKEAYLARWRPREEALRGKMQRKDGKVLEPSEEEKAEMAALAAEALAEADAAETDDARMLLRLAHLDLFTAYDDDAAARARAEWLLERVEPADPRLGLFYNIGAVLGRASDSDAALSTRVEAWYERKRANPEPELALNALGVLIYRADERSDDRRVAELYAFTRAPSFAGMYEVESLAQRFDPERILQRGKPFPDFEFPALAAGDPPVTKAERQGQLYLVEFWATWCGPCVGEMPKLHAAYARVNGAKPGKGEDGMRRLEPVERPKIEFVFVSLDESPDAVVPFRKEHWSMPWTHAFVGRAGETEVYKRYGFSGIPTAILVDGTGTIVAAGGELRGERLLPTLERALTPEPAPASGRE